MRGQGFCVATRLSRYCSASQPPPPVNLACIFTCNAEKSISNQPGQRHQHPTPFVVPHRPHCMPQCRCALWWRWLLESWIHVPPKTLLFLWPIVCLPCCFLPTYLSTGFPLLHHSTLTASSPQPVCPEIQRALSNPASSFFLSLIPSHVPVEHLIVKRCCGSLGPPAQYPARCFGNYTLLAPKRRTFREIRELIIQVVKSSWVGTSWENIPLVSEGAGERMGGDLRVVPGGGEGREY